MIPQDAPYRVARHGDISIVTLVLLFVNGRVLLHSIISKTQGNSYGADTA